MSVASAPGPHGGEGLVARGVDEGDEPVVLDGLVGADRLGDATGLAGHHVGVADLVEQLRLAVVDVAHHGDDRRKRHGGLVVAIEEGFDAEHLLELDLLLLAGVDEADVGVDLLGEQLDLLVAQRLGGGDHLAELHEEPDDVGRRAVQSWVRAPEGSSCAR